MRFKSVLHCYHRDGHSCVRILLDRVTVSQNCPTVIDRSFSIIGSNSVNVDFLSGLSNFDKAITGTGSGNLDNDRRNETMKRKLLENRLMTPAAT